MRLGPQGPSAGDEAAGGCAANFSPAGSTPAEEADVQALPGYVDFSQHDVAEKRTIRGNGNLHDPSAAALLRVPSKDPPMLKAGTLRPRKSWRISTRSHESAGFEEESSRNRSKSSRKAIDRPPSLGTRHSERSGGSLQSRFSQLDFAKIGKPRQDDSEEAAQRFEDRMLLASGAVGPRALENMHLMEQGLDASRLKVHGFISWWVFDTVMGIIIASNSITIGVRTSYSVKDLDPPFVVEMLELIFLGLYTAEVFLRLYAYGFMALKGNWLRFDIVIVTCGFLELMLEASAWIGQIMVVRMLRLIRLARFVRLMVQFKTLWLLVQGLVCSVGTLMWTAITMALVMYLFAIAGMEVIRPTSIYGEMFEAAAHSFRGLGTSMLTLLQFLTLDTVSVIYRPLIKGNPFLILYFAAFILIGSIAMINLVTAIMVEASMKQTASDKEGQRAWANQKKKKMIPKLHAMFDALDQDGSGDLTLDEIENAPPELLAQLGQAIDMESVPDIFSALDIDGGGSVSVEEFIEGIMRAQDDKPMDGGAWQAPPRAAAAAAAFGGGSS
eukprot:TRINITY_DN10030_c0_g1_i2.p1 TRINITY_DN10030_c0_g1~~TRINITY_DN10030_c0_g1_i2.p1  ORF type:complete len:555 (+),score=135.19 TRINITY_DN10030_c0_g1_i2:266-1930(+)